MSERLRMRVGAMTWTVRVGGRGRPVLFLHGFTGSGLSWAGIAGLGSRVRAIVPDLPGHGGTGWERASVERTGRLVVAEEQVHAAGWGATLISELAQAGVSFTAPPRRVSLPDDYPIPYTPPLEDLIVPSAATIADAARAAAGR